MPGYSAAEIARRDKIRDKAKSLTGTNLRQSLEGRLGLIMDSTARDYDRISNEARFNETTWLRYLHGICKYKFRGCITKKFNER